MTISKLLWPVLILATVFVSAPPVYADDSQAREILRQARMAIGGEEGLQKVQSLTIKGQFRRLFGEREITGDREISILLPDKYLTEDATNPGGLSTAIIMSRGLNGAHAWNSSSGGGGGGLFIRMNGPGGQQPSPEQMEAMFKRQYGLEFTRYLLAILLTPPPALSVEYKYAGESDVEDARADVVEVSGPEKLAIRIFFDKQTHMPLLLSYRGIKPRIMTSFRMAGEKNAKADEMEKKMREDAATKLASEPIAKPEEVDFFIRLTEFKKVNGLTLPHKLTFLTEAEVSEEFQISKYQLNPQFKSDKFEKH